MDRLEALVRDTLAEHADAAPVALSPRGGRRRAGSRRRTWWAAAAAAAVVGAIAVGLAVARSGHQVAPTGGHPPQLSERPSSPGPSRPTGPPSTARVPAGYKLVSYRDIEVAVPRALKVTHSPCGPPVNAVYAPIDAPYSCAAPVPGHIRRLPKTAVGVWLGARAYDPVSSTPEPTGHRTVGPVEVTVRAPTRNQVNAILDSIRAVAVDRLGCVARPASITPAGQPAAAELIPRGATSAVVCEYSALGGPNDAYVLVGSSRLPDGAVADLAALIDGLPARAHAVKNPITVEYDWIRFGYPSGATRIVAVPTNYAPTFITDGNRIVVDTNPGIDLIPLLPQD